MGFVMQAKPIEITLLRHGESTFNAKGLYQGASDQPRLTPSGRAQAALAAGQLVGNYDEVWVSPLSRAAETAEILASARPLPEAKTMGELCEIDLPEWEAVPFSKIKLEQKERHQTWKFKPNAFMMTGPKGGAHHPLEDIMQRAKAVLDKARALSPGSRVLLVTHSGFIRASLVAALGLELNHLHAARIDNCGVSKLSLFTDGTARLDGFNQTAAWPHMPSLPQDQPKILLTGLEGLVAMSKSFPRARPYALDDQMSELMHASADTVLAYGSQDKIARFIEQVLGLEMIGTGALSLDREALHIALPKGASDPARLWHMNLALPKLWKPESAETNKMTPIKEDVF